MYMYNYTCSIIPTHIIFIPLLNYAGNHTGSLGYKEHVLCYTHTHTQAYDRLFIYYSVHINKDTQYGLDQIKGLGLDTMLWWQRYQEKMPHQLQLVARKLAGNVS